ncbi:MAG: 50S ribosomal protein L17 [Candidatus Buchananbacteria bacterium]|nr:50S ribosomal protein L17 [Candidatus Buchananbacteria bacterium]
MRHRKQGKTFGRTKAPRVAMMRSMVTSFMIYERIETTETKVKALRPVVERLVTLAKVDSLHGRRQALKTLYVEGAVRKLFEVLGPRFKERPGGYTRITKLAPRRGDNAKMAVLEFVE